MSAVRPTELRPDPVILLRMHHSGTSIFAEVLHPHGVYMHATMRHHESKLFTRRINDELIMGGGANWPRNPIMPVEEVLGRTEQVRESLGKKTPQEALTGWLRRLLGLGLEGPANLYHAAPLLSNLPSCPAASHRL